MVRRIGTILCLAIVGFCLIGCFDAADAKNLDDIIALLNAKVGEEVIKTHIINKAMVFDLSTADIINLKKSGASDELIAFMQGGSDSEFPFELEDGFIVKNPVAYKHLSIFPVYRKTSATVGDYITLDQAQNAKVIIIKEKSSASVPTVIIKNIGNRPIYIMAGEIIIGGKQDRMVSFDILIPGHKELDVEVRCVEHGRWQGKSDEFASGGAVAGKSVRSALQFKAQQDVWDEVADACEKYDVETGSGTYGAVLSSEEIDKKSKPFLAAMKKALEDDKMVGMIAAINGEVICIDIFNNPKFFKEVKEKLLKAYVLDALSAEEETTRAPTKQDILAFFEEMKEAQQRESKKYDDNRNIEYESDIMQGNESRDAAGNLQHLNLMRK